MAADQDESGERHQKKQLPDHVCLIVYYGIEGAGQPQTHLLPHDQSADLQRHKWQAAKKSDDQSDQKLHGDHRRQRPEIQLKRDLLKVLGVDDPEHGQTNDE